MGAKSTDPNAGSMMQDDNDDDERGDNAMPLEPAEDPVDDTPEFVTDEDAVEVQVDDDDVPMDDDDDDDDDDAEGEMQQAAEASKQEEQPPVPDMAQVKLESHKGPVYAVAAHVDPSTGQFWILTGGGDDKAFVHKGGMASSLSSSSSTERMTALQSKRLEYAHTDSVSSVAWNLAYVAQQDPPPKTPNPRLAAVGAYDGAICLYNADTGVLENTLEGPTDVECLAFHPKGGTVLLAGSAADGTLWMYHLTLNKCLQVFVGHESAVTACQFSVDGRWALSASSDGTLRIWAPRTGACKHVFPCTQGQAGLTCLALGSSTAAAAAGELVVVGSENGNAYVCHIGSKKIIATLAHAVPDPNMVNAKNNNDDDSDDGEGMELPLSVEAVGFSPGQPHWCATGGVDGVLKIWDLNANASCRQTCRGDDAAAAGSGSGGITRLVWHPSLPLVWTATTSGRIHLWDARNGRLLRTYTGHTNVVNDMNVEFVGVSGEIAWVVTGSDDETVRVFHVDVTALWNDATQNP